MHNPARDVKFDAPSLDAAQYGVLPPEALRTRSFTGLRDVAVEWRGLAFANRRRSEAGNDFQHRVSIRRAFERTLVPRNDIRAARDRDQNGDAHDCGSC